MLIESRLEIAHLLLERGDLLWEGQQLLDNDERRLHERLHKRVGSRPNPPE